MITRNVSVFNSILLGVHLVSAYTSSEPGTQDGCYWTVPGAGTFNTHLTADWAANPGQAVDGITSSTYTVAAGNSPRARRFDMVNIGFDSDAVTLTVPGGQGASTGPVSSAQLITTYEDILYGSVRTVAMVSNVSGTTHGFSMYSNDNQEIDLAFLTRDLSQVHFTNEQVATDSPLSTYTYPAPSDASTAWHEYRVDWLPGHTAFFIDGNWIMNITENVPQQPGSWLWNHWSNGNAWTNGPPQEDAVLKIRSIDAYYNRVAVAAAAMSNLNWCGNSVSPSSLSSGAPSVSMSSASDTGASATLSSSPSTTAPATFVTSIRGSATATVIAPAVPFSAFQPVTGSPAIPHP